MKNKIFSIILVSLVFSVNAFTEGIVSQECVVQQEHSSLTYLLVDRTDNLENKDSFEKSINALSSMIKPGERLLIGASTDKASDTRIIFDLVKPKANIWISKLKSRALEKKFSECLENTKNKLLNEKESHKKSALIETLRFVGKVLQSDSVTQKRVVLYSDMMQNSSTISFYSMKPFSKAKALSLVEKESLFANLQSAEIFVSGAGSNVSDKLNRQLEDFWMEFFEKSKAKLKFYGPVLVPVGN